MDTTDELLELSRLRTMLRSGAARSIRQAAGLSLGEVARAVGVARPTILRWERNERRPRGDAALRYWALLNRLMEGGR